MSIRNNLSAMGTGHEKEFEHFWDVTLKSMKEKPIYSLHFDFSNEAVTDTFKTVADIFFAIGLETGMKKKGKKGKKD